MDSAELLLPWLLSAVEERYGFHVSACAEVISPTSAARSDWKQRLLCTEAFDKRAIVNAALRPGTAAVVKISAGLDCVAVSPLGSVVMPASASFMPQTTA